MSQQTNDPAAEQIQFDKITLPGGLAVDVMLCGKCRALVMPRQVQKHTDWHAALNRAVAMAGMGFGGGMPFVGGSL